MAATLVERGFCSLARFIGAKENDFEISGGMVVLICGAKGDGKTTLMAHIAGMKMLPPEADEAVAVARAEANYLRAHGYPNVAVPEDVQHLVYSTIPIQTCKDQGYLERYTWDLNVERMRVKTNEDQDEDFDAQLFPVGSTLIMDELMSIWDARDHASKSGAMPKGTRKFLQICRHRKIAIVATSLVADGTDKRCRQMSNNILQIVHREDFDADGKRLPHDNTTVPPAKTVWYCLEFQNADDCDAFMEHKKVPCTPRKFVHYGNIHDAVDSHGENNEFLAGMENQSYEFNNRRVG